MRFPLLTRSDVLALAFSLLLTAATFYFKGPVAGTVCLVLSIIGFVIWYCWEERITPEIPSAAKWTEMAERFNNAHQHARAYWHSDSFDFYGQESGEQWYISGAGDENKTVESLCALAGSMLKQSPRIAPQLSEKVRSRSNDAWRWLYFLIEEERPPTSMGTASARGFEKKVQTAIIEKVSSVSARVCIRCAARET